jgi:DNA repair exonuclease SbcCD ATPase subunit
LNVIKGDNESGKTTIVTAIAAALYGNPEKQTVFENANWNARSSGGNCPDVKIKAAIDGPILTVFSKRISARQSSPCQP